MFDIQREKKKQISFLLLTIFFGVLFAVGCILVLLDISEPIYVIIPPMLVAFVCSALYRNSKKAIKENLPKE